MSNFFRSTFFRLGVSLLLLGLIGWKTEWEKVGNAFTQFQVSYWIAAVVLLVVSQVASAWRWQLFAQELRFTAPLGRFFSMYLIGMYFNLCLPSSVGGDVVRAWYLDQGSGRRLAAFAAVFLERLNGLLVLIALACLAVTLSPLDLPTWIPASVWGIAGCAVLGLTGLIFLQRWHKLPEKRQRQLQTMVQALHSPRALVEATLMSIFVQVANVLIVWLVGLSLGIEIPGAYYFVFVPMVSLLTLLPISVNGMGVREAGITLFLAHLGTVNEGSALALSIMWFVVYGVVSLMGGVVYLFGSFPKPIAQVDAGNEGDEDEAIRRDSDQRREGQFRKAA